MVCLYLAVVDGFRQLFLTSSHSKNFLLGVLSVGVVTCDCLNSIDSGGMYKGLGIAIHVMICCLNFVCRDGLR